MAKVAVAIALAVGVLPVNDASWAQPPEGHIALENDSVRVTQLIFRSGAGTGRHLGLEPELGIVLEGELTLETPSGRQTLGPGAVYWMPSLTPHDVRNEGDRAARLWDILLRRCE